MTLLQFLASRNIPYRPHSTHEDEIWLCCPLCDDERFRLGVNVRKNMGHCFNGTCGFRTRKATSALAFHFGVAAFRAEGGLIQAPEKPKEIIRLPEDYTLLWSKSDSLLRKARRYATKRGLTRELAKSLYVGASFSGRFGYRVIFPVVANNYLVGLVARDFTDTQTPKYLFTTGTKHAWNARPAAEMVLSEGVFKAIRLERALGVPSAALLGHTVTEEMLAQFKSLGLRRALLWPDPDRAGVTGILKVLARMREAGVACYLPTELPDKPADDAKLSDLVLHARFDSADKLKNQYMQRLGQ